MGKGDKRRKSIGVDLAPVPKREKDGKSTRRKRTLATRRERDPARVVLAARARRMGSDDLSAMRAQAIGHPGGMALCMACDPDEAASLWSVYSAYMSAEERFHRTCHGISIHPKTAKVEYFPETVEADPDDEPDMRDEDEKHRDAQNGWATWCDRINRLSLVDRSIIQSVSRGWLEPVIDGKLNERGKHFVDAVRRLSEVD